MHRISAVKAWALSDVAALHTCNYTDNMKLVIVSSLPTMISKTDTATNAITDANTTIITTDTTMDITKTVKIEGMTSFRQLVTHQCETTCNTHLMSVHIIDGNRTNVRVATYVFRPIAGCYVRTIYHICDTFDSESNTLTRCIKSGHDEYDIIPWQSWNRHIMTHTNKSASNTFLNFYMAVWGRDTKQLQQLIDANAIMTVDTHDCKFTLRTAPEIIEYMDLTFRITRLIELVSFDSNFSCGVFASRVIVRENKLNMKTMTWSEYTCDTKQDICINENTNTIIQINVY